MTRFCRQLGQHRSFQGRQTRLHIQTRVSPILQSDRITVIRVQEFNTGYTKVSNLEIPVEKHRDLGKKTT